MMSWGWILYRLPIPIILPTTYFNMIFCIKLYGSLIILFFSSYKKKGFILVFGGAFLPDMIGWVRDRLSKGTPSRDEESLETVTTPDSDDFEISSLEFEVISCPTCGHMTDGMYCEECGSQLRKID